MMKPRAEDLEQLNRLLATAEKLLDAAAASPEPATDDALRDLKHIAGFATKIAFGSASPELLTDDMQNLIRWTDHLDDTAWSDRFRTALRSRPLISPWTQTI
jgi:hypothetical protein